MNQSSPLPYVFLLSFFWGTNAVASRFGIGEFEPFQFITLRLLIALVFFVPFVLITQGGFPTDRTLWQNAMISGIFGVAIPIPTFIWSLQFQSSGVAS
ncbi:MAG: DMT family transporter, partial [Chloroflexota bacterium]